MKKMRCIKSEYNWYIQSVEIILQNVVYKIAYKWTQSAATSSNGQVKHNLLYKLSSKPGMRQEVEQEQRRERGTTSPQAQSRSKEGKSRRPHWPAGWTYASLDLCTLRQDRDCTGHPAQCIGSFSNALKLRGSTK